MKAHVRKAVPPERKNLSPSLWRWFWRGALVWGTLAAAAALLLPGTLAPWYREARNAVVATSSALGARPASTADFAPIAHTGENLFGINTFLYQEVEEAKIRRSLALIKEAGFGFIREQVAWQEFERGQKGNYWDERHNRPTWDNLDRLVRLVNEAGLQLIARVDYPPDWAMPPGTTWHATPPARYEDYGDFLYTLAKRYQGKVKYYQVWNEPNLTIEWGMKNVSPEDYARLLKVAYTRLKEADPGNVVIAAALAPTIERGPENMNDLLYLRRLYEAGAKDYFDILSVNPYGLRSGPDDRRFSDDDTNFSRPIRAREIMVEFGDASKPIWASETGWCALPADFPAAPLYGRTTREQQARYTVRAYERVQQEWPWLGMMALWHFRMVDNRLATQQPYYFGIVDDDFTPLPVYEAVKALANRPAAVYPGFRQEDHRALAFTGEWRQGADASAALGRYVETRAPGSKVTFRFWGTRLDLIAATGPDGGRAEVSIDGRASAANLATRDGAGRAVVDLRAAERRWQSRVPIAAGLPPGEHTAEITLVEGVLALDGVLVQAQAPREPEPWRLLAALVLGLAVYRLWAVRQGGGR